MVEEVGRYAGKWLTGSTFSEVPITNNDLHLLKMLFWRSHGKFISSSYKIIDDLIAAPQN